MYNLSEKANEVNVGQEVLDLACMCLDSGGYTFLPMFMLSGCVLIKQRHTVHNPTEKFLDQCKVEKLYFFKKALRTSSSWSLKLCFWSLLLCLPITGAYQSGLTEYLRP